MRSWSCSSSVSLSLLVETEELPRGEPSSGAGDESHALVDVFAAALLRPSSCCCRLPSPLIWPLDRLGHKQKELKKSKRIEQFKLLHEITSVQIEGFTFRLHQWRGRCEGLASHETLSSSKGAPPPVRRVAMKCTLS
jgi:hypothetical protein